MSHVADGLHEGIHAVLVDIPGTDGDSAVTLFSDEQEAKDFQAEKQAEGEQVVLWYGHIKWYGG